MSDSEDLSSAAGIPDDAEIEKCLRTVVREAVKKGEEVTVNLGRTRAEERLGLDEGFFKSNVPWKQRSKDLISAAFEEPASPEVSKTTSKAKPAAKAGTKRKSDEAQNPRKKARKGAVSDFEDDAVDSAGESSGPNTDEETADNSANGASGQLRKSDNESALSDPPEETEAPILAKDSENTGDDNESELSDVIDDPPPKKKRQKNATAKTTVKAPSKAKETKAKETKAKETKAKETKAKETKASKPNEGKTAAEVDESDLSSVIDEPQPKRGRKKKSTSPGPASKSKAKPAANKDLSPDEEEIKRLQSWLLKCGVRKLWHKELAPYDSNKDKIKHLKSMLEDVGMTGRYSAEKAKQIKEARELKAELEAATEFNKTWGHDNHAEDDEDANSGSDSGEQEGAAPAPGRRAKPKGFVDFGDSDEDSE